ncbi:MAG: helix-turn-helix domain-containing protein, partial [Pseudonocardiaceae bacterium]
MGAITAPRYCCCGARLASDNVGTRCASCQRQNRDRLIAPPVVPATFWQTDQLRDAFAARHIGKVCRAYRLHPYHAATYGPGGISQSLLGQWVGLTQAQVSRIENGPAMKHLDTLAHWARVLRIPPESLWFDMPGSQRYAAANGSTSGVEGVQKDQGEEDTAKRREAVTLVGKVLTAAVQPGILSTVERVASGHRRERVDHRLVSAHQEVAEALAGLYRSADPRSALPTTMAYADELLNLLDAPMGDNERAVLNAIVVGVHAQVGLWACHMHRSSLAYRYLATGCEVAAAAHDRPLRARALGALSYLFSSAPRGGQGGNPRRSLELLDEALDLAVHADPFTRGWLATWRADQHAT